MMLWYKWSFNQTVMLKIDHVNRGKQSENAKPKIQ